MMKKYVDYACEYAPSRDSFLELGIGHGHTVRLLAKEFTNLTVVDAEEQFVREYQTQLPGVHFVHEYFEAYDPGPTCFTNIGVGFVLDMVSDPLGILRRYAGYLDRKGRMYVSIGNAASLHRLIALNAGLIDHVRTLSESNVRFGHRRFNTYRDWVELIERADLTIIAAHGLYLKPFSTSQLVGLNLPESVKASLVTTARDLPEISNACCFVIEKP